MCYTEILTGRKFQILELGQKKGAAMFVAEAAMPNPKLVFTIFDLFMNKFIRVE